MKNFLSVIMITLALTSNSLVQAELQHAENKGYAIAKRSDKTNIGFADSKVQLQMQLKNAAGKSSTRQLTVKTLEIADKDLGDRSLIVFNRPADVKGTALLSHAKILDADDQWLFLPALKRTKRISSVNKSGPFVGSEFAFEDLTALELNKYRYKYLGTEPCGELQCDKVERIPLYAHSGYTKQIAWIDQKVYQIRKITFFDRRGDLLKTLEYTDYRQYPNGFWRAHNMEMTNHLTRKSTTLTYNNFQFGNHFSENDFIKGALRRAR